MTRSPLTVCLCEGSRCMLALDSGVLQRGLRCSLKTYRPSREAHSMLVLTRKSNQSIMIGDDIEVTVLAIMGGKVRVGIQAPRDIAGVAKEVSTETPRERMCGGKVLDGPVAAA